MKNYVYILVLCFITNISCKDHVAKKERTESEHMVALISPFANPTTENSSTPRFFSSGSKIYMSWVLKNKDTSKLKFASYDSKEWSETTQVVTGNDWFNNWADFPTITESKNNILTTHLQKSAPGTYTYDVKLSIYNDSLKKWKKNIILHTDGTKSEHGFVSAVPDTKGGFYVSWLDGRNITGSGHHDSENNDGGAMTLRTAKVSSLGVITNEKQIDSRVCDCCGTSMAMSNRGPVVVYRDRTEEELRDISISRLVDSIWEKPLTVHNDNWKINGCPVNGPIVSSFKDQLAVAWFTGVNNTPKVQLVFSENAGKSFGMPIRIDSSNTLGRIDLKMINSNEAIITWMEQLGTETLIQLLKVHRNGTKSTVITLSKTSAERASGFPQIAVLGNQVYAAMTITTDGKPSRIKTVIVDLENI